MPAPFLAALFALAAAFVWGTGDFTSGLAARRIGAFHALLVSFMFGLLSTLAVTLASGEAFPAQIDLLWGVVAGLLGTAGFMAMLHGFATGRMSIVAPVSGVLAAGIPVIFAAVREGLPGELQLFGFVLAFASIWLLSLRHESEKRPTGFGLALLAGLGFGLFFTALDQISAGAVFWPLVASRLVSTLLLASIALSTRRPLVPKGAPIRLLALAGVLDVLGNVLFLLAVQTGRLDIAAVLVSLYPAVTVLLATWIAKERMTRLQIVGVVIAIAAIALITL